MMSKNIEINGSIEVNVSHDEFLEEFYKWLESKDWSFFGMTEELKEEKE